MPQHPMTPLTLVTGFLGAGKTTLLNRVLQSDHAAQTAVIVNDFGTINLDAQFIHQPNTAPFVTLENGCICCTLRDDLISTLHELLKRSTPPQYIMIEASGVSDPQQILLALNRSNIRNYFQIDSLITVVDAEQVNDLNPKQKRLARDQIRMASVVVINKIDLVSERQLADVRAWAEEIAPTATMLETVRSNLNVDDVLQLENYNPQTAFDTSGPGVHVYAAEDEKQHQHNDHSLVFSTWTWETDDAVALDALREVMTGLPLEVFRAKGVIAVPDQDHRLIVHMVGKRINIEQGLPWDDTPRQSTITMIGDKGSLDTTDLAARFNATRITAPADASPEVSLPVEWNRQPS